MDFDKYKKEIGKRIAEIRKNKNLKQAQLKELIGAPTVQMISNWENGHSFPSTIYLIIIAKKLDISLDYLLFGKDVYSKIYKIDTYKEVGQIIVELISSGLFFFSSSSLAKRCWDTDLNTSDKTIYNFSQELCHLLAASGSLRPELFEQAIEDLLNKYDSPIKKNEE